MPTDRDDNLSLAAPPTDLPRVLLVDDDPALLQLLVRWLRGYGLALTTATSGLDALTRFENQSFHLIVADYYLPGMNGLRLLDVVKTRWPDCRRILYTAHADSEMVLDAVDHRVLTKQMDMMLVRDAIVNAARQR